MMIILIISLKAYLLGTSAKNTLWCVCNLNKIQFLYSTEYIQLNIIVHFILTIICPKECYFSISWKLDIIFNGSTFFDANETAAKEFIYSKRPFEVGVFFISYNGFGFLVWFGWAFFSWVLLPLNISGQIAGAQKPAWRWRLEQLLNKTVFLNTPQAVL